jgi:hypothetical protein
MDTKKNVMQLTTGAMLVAIFGLMILLNRQTGGTLEGVFHYLVPIPMVAYTALYGPRSSLSVFAAMALLAVFLGSLNSLFCEMAYVLVGFILGICLYKRVDSTRTLLIVMVIAILVSIADTFMLSIVSGVSILSEVKEMQEMMRQIFQQSGMTVPEAMLDEGYLLRILMISMAFAGALQGFIIYEISLLLLRKLRFQVQKPRPISSYHPPKWTGILAAAAVAAMMAVTSISISPEGKVIEQYSTIYAVCQTFGLIASMYLVAFGIIALARLLTAYGVKNKVLRVIVCILSMFCMSQLVMVLGFLYIMRLTELIRSLDE